VLERIAALAQDGGMKILFVVRHAKSSWKQQLPDDERPLAARGERDAPRMGKRLARRRVRPDLILSSPARRALATARIVAKQLAYKRKHIEVDARLYPGSVRQLLTVVRGLDDRLKRVMVFGHNPALESFAHRLSAKIERMPTGAVAEFRFDSPSWNRVGKLSPTHASLDIPKKK
jgi:phosphohistidine phosphatase